jgi:hypothetical protein
MNISFSGLISNETVTDKTTSTGKSASASDGDFDALLETPPSQTEEDTVADTDEVAAADGAEDASESDAVQEDPDEAGVDEAVVDISEVDGQSPVVAEPAVDNELAADTAPQEGDPEVEENASGNAGDGDDPEVGGDTAAIPYEDVRLSGPNDIQAYDRMPDQILMAQQAVMPVQAVSDSQISADMAQASLKPEGGIAASAQSDAPNIQTQKQDLANPATATPAASVRTGDNIGYSDVIVEHQAANQKPATRDGSSTAALAKADVAAGTDFGAIVDGEMAMSPIRKSEAASATFAAPARESTTAQSPMVQKVVDQIAKIPNTDGTTTIKLTPHGMGSVEITVEKMSNGRIDVELRVQNPLVLEAMRNERGAISHLFSSQGNNAGGSLSMELMNSGGGQQSRDDKASSDAGKTSETGVTDEEPEETIETPRIQGGSGSLNILT